MEQPREHLRDMAIMLSVLGKETIVVLEVPEAEEEEAEALEEIRDVRTRLEPTSSAMNVPTASTTASCSMTRWPCQTSTASRAATAATNGGPRRGAT